MSTKRKRSATKIRWRRVESSNVEALGWDREEKMYVLFKHGSLYVYSGVPRQKVVAAIRSSSVGSYVNREIIPNHPATKIETPVLTIL